MSVPLNNLTDTWNASGTTFTAIRMNVTDTGHAAASRLLDLQVGGVSQFSVDAAGVLAFASNIRMNSGSTSIYDYGVTRTGQSTLQNNASGATLVMQNNSTSGFCTIDFYDAAGTQKGSFGWGNSGVGTTGLQSQLFLYSATAPFLFNPGGNVIEQRNSGSAQIFRVYNFWTDASNYERGLFGWGSNVLYLGTENAGTGTQRTLNINSAGTNMQVAGATQSTWLTNQLILASGLCLGWNTPDVGISRIAAGVLGFGNGAAADISGFFQWGGLKRVATDVTWTSNTTISVCSGLNVTVTAGRNYVFEAHLFIAAGAGGIQCTIGGTCTATSILYDGFLMDDSNQTIKGGGQGTALNAVVASGVLSSTSSGRVIIRGIIAVNAGGALTVRAAQNTSSGTTTTVKAGSWFRVYDIA